MDRRIDRRTFIKQSTAVTGGLALTFSAGFPVLARATDFRSPAGVMGETMVWYGLDPEWGAGTAGCPITPEDTHTHGGSCHACNACHLHGDNKIFATAEAANANRAHLHCKCLVYEGGELPADIWEALFGDPENLDREHVDRRWDWVIEALTGESCELDFAHPAIEATWARTDKPVIDGIIARTWMWGPGPFTCAMQESYVEAPGGMRLVQYYDKSRMEITNPGGDQNSIWYVTNGLLVVELITGDRQMGHNDFDSYSPANVNVAGDADDPDGPTYMTFGGVLDAAPLPVGSTITQTINRAGVVSNDPSLGRPERDSRTSGRNHQSLRGIAVLGLHELVRNGLRKWCSGECQPVPGPGVRHRPADHRAVLGPGEGRQHRPARADAVLRAPLPHLHPRQRPCLAGRSRQRRPALLRLALRTAGHRLDRSVTFF
jgi:hypothetical protein